MRCYECGGEYSERHGVLRRTDPIVGAYSAKLASYEKCSGCGNCLFSVKAARAIETARAKALDELLQKMPIEDFLTATEAADCLGISRQAIHKNKRISRGFVFHTSFGGKTVYLKASVILFRDSEDGRFPLVSPVDQVKYAHKHDHVGSLQLEQSFAPAHSARSGGLAFLSPNYHSKDRTSPYARTK
jgi:hypothetical protein